MAYKIVRFYERREQQDVRGMSGLSLERAQEHCSDPQSSWKTATGYKARSRTKKYGPWFEGFVRE